MKTSRWRMLVGIALVVALSTPAKTAAAKDLVVGLVAPSLPLARVADRVAFVERLARHLSAALAQPVKGRVYASARLLAAAARRREAQFAIVDPEIAASGLPTFRSLAIALRKGRAANAWALVGSSKKQGVESLKGLRIATAQRGRAGRRFVLGAILEDQVPEKWFKWVGAPGAAAAMALVKLGRADVAALPLDQAGGLNAIVVSRPLPNPVLGVLDKRVAKGTTDAVRRALNSFADGPAAISGWKASGGGTIRRLAGFLGKPRRRIPLLAPRRTATVSPALLFSAPSADYTLPKIFTLFDDEVPLPD